MSGFMEEAQKRGGVSTRKLIRVVARALSVGVVLLASGVDGATMYWPLPGLDMAAQRASGIACINNLVQIRAAARAWAVAHSEQFPASFQVFTNELSSPAPFFCPGDLGAPAATNWAGFDWAGVDYQWLPQPNWDDPEAVCCKCRIHENDLRVDGFVPFAGRFRSGWPTIVAGPLGQSVTPGAQAKFEVRVAPDAALPLTYQWRREQLYFVTNVSFVTQTNLPGGGYWVTNRLGKFAVTNLAGETNSSYIIASAQTNHADYYSVMVSNSFGATASRGASLAVDSNVSGMATNDYWSGVNCLNNLRQIALLGRMWALEHDDHMPQSLSEMTNSYGLPLFGWPVVLFCRADTTRTAPGDWIGFNFSNTSYEVLAGNEEDLYAVFCRCKVHGFYTEMSGETISGPEFFRISKQSGSGAELTFRVFAGRTNVLEASTNLTNWTALQTYASTNGQFVFLDTNSVARRFYRLHVN
jgi:hypothetical protein